MNGLQSRFSQAESKTLSPEEANDPIRFVKIPPRDPSISATEKVTKKVRLFHPDAPESMGRFDGAPATRANLQEDEFRVSQAFFACFKAVRLFCRNRSREPVEILSREFTAVIGAQKKNGTQGEFTCSLPPVIPRRDPFEQSNSQTEIPGAPARGGCDPEFRCVHLRSTTCAQKNQNLRRWRRRFQLLSRFQPQCAHRVMGFFRQAERQGVAAAFRPAA